MTTEVNRLNSLDFKGIPGRCLPGSRAERNQKILLALENPPEDFDLRLALYRSVPSTILSVHRDLFVSLSIYFKVVLQTQVLKEDITEAADYLNENRIIPAFPLQDKGTTRYFVSKSDFEKALEAKRNGARNGNRKAQIS